MFSARKTFFAVPSLVATTPQHSFGNSSRAWPTMSSRNAREIRTALPPNGGVDRFQLVDRLRPEARRQVLVAAVGDDEDDVPLVELARDASRDRGDRAGRHAREDALFVEELLGPDDPVAVRDEDLPVEQRDVDDRRDEAVVQRAKALDVLALERLRRDDLGRRVVLLEAAAVPHQRAAGAEPGDER